MGEWRTTCFLFCLHGAAQGCRGSETKHDASEAEGPSSKAKRGEKGSSHSGRGRGGQEGGEGEGGKKEGGGGGATHPSVCIEIRLSPNSSGFSVRCERVNGLETSEAAAVKRTHTDVSILSASLFVLSLLLIILIF